MVCAESRVGAGFDYHGVDPLRIYVTLNPKPLNPKPLNPKP